MRCLDVIIHGDLVLGSFSGLQLYWSFGAQGASSRSVSPCKCITCAWLMSMLIRVVSLPVGSRKRATLLWHALCDGHPDAVGQGSLIGIGEYFGEPLWQLEHHTMATAGVAKWTSRVWSISTTPPCIGLP